MLPDCVANLGVLSQCDRPDVKGLFSVLVKSEPARARGNRPFALKCL